MIRIAVERRIRVGFNSNATLLTGRRAAELVDSRVDWLHVSLDGSSAAAYEKVHDGASFDAVLTNLAGLVRAKREAGSATPWIRVVFVAMRDNVGELPALVRLLGEIGVDELRVQNSRTAFPTPIRPAGTAISATSPATRRCGRPMMSHGRRTPSRKLDRLPAIPACGCGCRV